MSGLAWESWRHNGNKIVVQIHGRGRAKRATEIAEHHKQEGETLVLVSADHPYYRFEARVDSTTPVP